MRGENISDNGPAKSNAQPCQPVHFCRYANRDGERGKQDRRGDPACNRARNLGGRVAGRFLVVFISRKNAPGVLARSGSCHSNQLVVLPPSQANKRRLLHSIFDEGGRPVIEWSTPLGILELELDFRAAGHLRHRPTGAAPLRERLTMIPVFSGFFFVRRSFRSFLDTFL